MKKVALIGLVLLVSLSACSVSINENGIPPAGVQTPLLSSTSTAVVNLPFVPPDPASGAAIFQNKCAPCHGTSGKGDGVQAGNLASAPPPIGTAELARQARPVDWFSIIDTGHLAKFMPSTSNTLTDRQRWDVVAYVLNLSMTLNEQTNGMVVYRQELPVLPRREGPRRRSTGSQPGVETVGLVRSGRTGAEIAAGFVRRHQPGRCSRHAGLFQRARREPDLVGGQLYAHAVVCPAERAADVFWRHPARRTRHCHAGLGHPAHAHHGPEQNRADLGY